MPSKKYYIKWKKGGVSLLPHNNRRHSEEKGIEELFPVYVNTYTMSIQIQLSEEKPSKPTAKEVEKVLINVIKAGLYYNKPKDGKFMLSYKERVKKIRDSTSPDEYVIRLAKAIFPNEEEYHRVKDDYKSWYGRNPEILNAIMELYKLYYELAKDSFITKEQLDKDAEDFLNE